MNRLVEDVAPLVTQGLTTREIAKELGIGPTQASLDVKKVKELWADEQSTSEICAVRGEAVARADYIWKTSIEAWHMSKRDGQPCGKFLDVALSAMRDKVKLSGAEIDLKLIQQNVNVSMASPEQVMNTFEPMSAEDFKAFAAAHTEAQIRAADAARSVLPKAADLSVSDQSSEISQEDWLAEADQAGAEEPTPQGKNHRVAHPFR